MILPLLTKILDISDMMIDTALDVCHNHLNSSSKEKDEMEFESGISNLSDDDNSSDISRELNKSSWTDHWNVNFHVFVPPEVCHNFENWEIGIAGTFNDWNPDKMSILSKEKKLANNGWLITGQIKFPLDMKEIEYKYILKETTHNRSVVWELLPNDRDGNRVLHVPTHLKSLEDIDVFDGIMLPHVNNRCLFDRYWNETLKIMLGELLNVDNKPNTFELVKDWLTGLTHDFKRIYKIDDNNLNNAICRNLMELLEERNDQKLIFLWTAAILAIRNEGEGKWTLNPDNLKSVLRSLNLFEQF